MPPVAPRTASVIVPLRPGDPGFEVLLLRRGGSARFMPGTWVFPGGRVEPDDGGIPCEVEPSTLARLALPASLARGLLAAAARELYEEAGILVSMHHLPESDRWDLCQRRIRMAPLCDRRGARLDLRGLLPWSRWVTPEIEPLRFDTHFFVAELAAGTRAVHNPDEMSEGRWLCPEEALRLAQAGQMPLSPPVFRTLEELASRGSLEQVRRDARTRSLAPILPRVVDIQPRPATATASVFGAGCLFLLPGDPDHPAAVAVEGSTRIRWDGVRFTSEDSPRPLGEP